MIGWSPRDRHCKRNREGNVVEHPRPDAGVPRRVRQGLSRLPAEADRALHADRAAYATETQKVGGETAELASKAGEDMTNKIAANTDRAAKTVRSAANKTA